MSHAQQVLTWLAAGHAAKAAAKAATEVTLQGHLRGGSVGAVGADGRVYGKCPRLAYLRSVGLQPPIEPASKFEMFEGGFANEAVVTELLTSGLDPGLKVLAGDATRGTWTLPDGTPVTGTADVLLADEGGGLRLGLELKCVSSLWTALAVHYDLRPKSDHLIQAAAYSLQHGKLPYVLLYSSRVEWHLSTAPKWLTEKFGPGVYDVEYKDDNRTPLKMLPFNRAYDLTWDAQGRLNYQTAGMAAPVATVVTAEAVSQYYAEVCRIRDERTLGARPCATSVDGSKSYSACDYCELAEVCDTTETEFNLWFDHVQAKIGGTVR